MHHYGDNEKFKLTPQKVNSDLKRHIGRDALVPTVVFSMLVVAGAAIVLAVFLSLTKQLFPALRVGISALIAIGAVICIGYIYKRSMGKYNGWAKEGKYHVVKATLGRTILQGYQGLYWFLKKPRVPFDNAFYFGDYEPYYAEEDELTRVTEGDEYYLVIFDEEPNRPRVIYRVDTYDWRG